MMTKSGNSQFYNIPFSVSDYRGMPYRRLGNSGLKVSNIGLGTWKMGIPETGDGARIDERLSLSILDRAAETGVTFWDTANRYNNASGNSERIIGKWFSSNPAERRNIVLATKLGGTMDGLTPNHAGLSRHNILESVYASLERLQLDCIDLLYFHAWDATVPVDESLLAIEDLVKQDLIRYFAVSNFTVAQMELYRSAAQSLSARSQVCAVQNQFDLLDGEGGGYSGVLQYAAKQGISYIAWSPMARGLLSDRYLQPALAKAGDRLFDEGLISEKVNDKVLEKLRGLKLLADEYEISLSQLAIAYMLQLPCMGPLIASVTSTGQLDSNAAAGKIILNEDQIKRVAAVVGHF